MVLFVATPAPKSMKEPERHPALLRLLEAALAVPVGAAEGSARASAERTSPKKPLNCPVKLVVLSPMLLFVCTSECYAFFKNLFTKSH